MHLKFCAALLLLTPVAFAYNLDLKTQLLSCQQISGEEQRLSCFDQIVSQLDSIAPQTSAVAPKASPAVSSGAPEAPVAATPAPQTTVEDFGLKTPRASAEIQEISSKVKTIQTDLRNKLLITLENGQKWQQIEQSYLKIKAGDQCTVERGSFGSFFLGVEGLNKKIRVRRVD